MENKYLKSTKILNYENEKIKKILQEFDLSNLNQKEKILRIYNFVRDDITFGYNSTDDIIASKVLEDGYGQCNTKGSLFMALLRAEKIPCRIHGFYIDKILQKGAMKSWYYKLSTKKILHSWVEIYYKDKWLNLEGFILDINYLSKLQIKFKDCKGSFCGYGVAINNFENPQIDWNENDTYIQKDGIIEDLGIYDSPDDFYSNNRQQIGGFKNFMFKHIVRKIMNKNIHEIRR